MAMNGPSELAVRMSALGRKADLRSQRPLFRRLRPFSPKSGRIDTVTVESARDPKRTFSRICGSAGGYRKPVFCVHPDGQMYELKFQDSRGERQNAIDVFNRAVAFWTGFLHTHHLT